MKYEPENRPCTRGLKKEEEKKLSMVKIAACAQARQPLPYFIPRKYAEQRKVEIFPKLDQMFNLALFNYTVRKFR